MEWLNSVGEGISGVATSLGTKIDKLAADYQLKEKLDATADAAEEKFKSVSGAYRKLVIAYLCDFANGVTPPPEMIHETFTFSDGNGPSRGADILMELSDGRTSAGTVQVFEEGQSFGFKMVQTIQVNGLKGVDGKDVSGKRLENVTTFGLVTCADGKILSHQQRGDDVQRLLASQK